MNQIESIILIEETEFISQYMKSGNTEFTWQWIIEEICRSLSPRPKDFVEIILSIILQRWKLSDQS